MSASKPHPRFRPSRYISASHTGRLEVSLVAVNRGFSVVWPTLAHASALACDREQLSDLRTASRIAWLGHRAEELREDLIPAALDFGERCVEYYERKLAAVEAERERLVEERADLVGAGEWRAA